MGASGCFDASPGSKNEYFLNIGLSLVSAQGLCYNEAKSDRPEAKECVLMEKNGEEMKKSGEYRPAHLAPEEKKAVRQPRREKAAPEREVVKPAKQKAAKKRRVPLPVWIILGVLVVVIGAGALVFNHFYSKMHISKASDDVSGLLDQINAEWLEGLSDEELSELDEELRRSLANKGDWDYDSADVTNILLIGVDNDNLAGMEARGNADGLIIVSINKSTKQVVLSSLMRDIYVSVPNAYNTKITLAYHYGGTQTLIDTVEANFDIPIDNYILVNYLNVIDIVDALGGVTMDVSANELYFMQEKIENLNTLKGLPASANIITTDKAGPILLNGIQTAAYLRVRMAGNNDFDRTSRARNVLLALKDKAADMSLLELNKLADVVLPCITTDMSQKEILSLLVSAPTYMQYKMVSNRIPIDDSYYFADINGSVVAIDYEVNCKFLYESIYQGK